MSERRKSNPKSLPSTKINHQFHRQNPIPSRLRLRTRSLPTTERTRHLLPPPPAHHPSSLPPRPPTSYQQLTPIRVLTHDSTFASECTRYRSFEYTDKRLTSVTTPSGHTCVRLYSNSLLVETAWKDPLTRAISRTRHSYAVPSPLFRCIFVCIPATMFENTRCGGWCVRVV